MNDMNDDNYLNLPRWHKGQMTLKEVIEDLPEKHRAVTEYKQLLTVLNDTKRILLLVLKEWPDNLRLLAMWLDFEQKKRTEWSNIAVQEDLRKMADVLDLARDRIPEFPKE